MAQPVVTASTDRVLGSRPSRRLRAEGRLPGVVYGLGRDPITVSVEYIALRDALKTDAGLNTVIELDLDNAAGTETVIVRSVQRDAIKRTVTHADFLRVDPAKPIKVKIPINLVGEALEVTNEGGMIEQKVFEIEVLVSPMSIPSEIECDVSSMTLNTGISIGDLPMPEGVTSATSDDISVVTPVISRAAKMGLSEDEEFALEGEGGEEEGEGVEGEGDADGESSDGGDE